jgi:Ca-activated chloride channel family protein
MAARRTPFVFFGILSLASLSGCGLYLTAADRPTAEPYDADVFGIEAEETTGYIGAPSPEAKRSAGGMDRAASDFGPSEPVVPEGAYVDPGVNGFQLTAEDRLSTFAIDVDTASYTMARKNLVTGYLPPTGAVRVEEFVNYFPYDYARPEGSDPFGVDFEGAPSPWDERLTLVRVGVQGKKVAFDERKPVNLTFLVDVSGSMRASDKLGLVKDSLRMLTEELEDGDTVSVVTYAGATKVVLPPTPISQRREIMASLSGLTAGGSTAMNSGIQLAYDLAEETFRPGSVNRVLVCSDGDANVGQTSADAMVDGIKGYAKKGITLTTLGFGNGNFQDARMEQLANQGDGNYYYIDSRSEARRVLVDRLTSTLEVIAKDVKIQVDWNPEAVSAYRLVGYENRDIADRDFRNDAVDAGEIGAGHQVTALYEVVLTGQSDSLATVQVRNKAPGPDAPAVERSWTLDAGAIRPDFGETTQAYRIAASAGYFAEVLRNSPHIAEIGLTQVAELARGAQRAEYPEDAELVSLIETAAELRGEGHLSRR